MIYNVELYNNHIRESKELSFTSVKVEETIKNYPYSGEGRVKDPKVENTQFPPIALTFYSFVYEFDIIPPPEVLVEEYLSQSYFREISENDIEVFYGENKTIVKKEGLIARILRTYPSILRDFHFYLLAMESNCFEAVRYSFEDDFKSGVDIKVKYNGKWFNIALMQKTFRSIFFRNKKKFRHDGKNIEIINVELDKNKSQRCGDYNLYTKNHVDFVLKTIQKK